MCGPGCAPSSLARALLRELAFLQRHCGGSGVTAFPEHEARITDWRATVDGPPGTPWEGRRVVCVLSFCPAVCNGSWPLRPPKLVVCDPIPHHPNVDAESGAVCMDLLQQHWSCAGGVIAILISFRSLLASPTTDDAGSMPANLAAAADLLTNPAAYHAKNVEIAAAMPPA